MALLIGGARSGKSSIAQQWAEQTGAPITIIVTGVAFDAEMRARIARHQADRPSHWTTVEAPHDLAVAIEAVPHDHVLVIDCLTLWVSNQLLASVATEQIEADATAVAAVLAARDGRTIVVSNETGQGIVPADALSRTFRDVHGRVNQLFARRCAATWLIIAGRLVRATAPDAVDPWG